MCRVKLNIRVNGFVLNDAHDLTERIPCPELLTSQDTLRPGWLDRGILRMLSFRGTLRAEESLFCLARDAERFLASLGMTPLITFSADSTTMFHQEPLS
jgi:hypothetical protein